MSPLSLISVSSCVKVKISQITYFDLSNPFWDFSDGPVVKNLPAMQETRVQSLGQEDSLEKEMATQSSILAWEIPWTEEPGVQSMGS